MNAVNSAEGVEGRLVGFGCDYNMLLNRWIQSLVPRSLVQMSCGQSLVVIDGWQLIPPGFGHIVSNIEHLALPRRENSALVVEPLVSKVIAVDIVALVYICGSQTLVGKPLSPIELLGLQSRGLVLLLAC